MVKPTKTTLEQSGDLAVMRFEGDITSTSEDAIMGRYRALDPGTKKILLDFSKVTYMNSSGIALIIQLLMAAGDVPQKVVCFGLSAHFVKVFAMLGLTKYALQMKPDETEARKAVE
jgi:anti-sigma B factor antagonist